MERAIRDVSAGRAGRICAPGEWVVWRENEIVMNKDLPA
jgi:hypothetical protein